MNAIADHAHLVDAADLQESGPTDVQIIDAVAEAFEMLPLAAIERLICMDFVAARREVMP